MNAAELNAGIITLNLVLEDMFSASGVVKELWVKLGKWA
jgi:hypothetical protein